MTIHQCSEKCNLIRDFLWVNMICLTAVKLRLLAHLTLGSEVVDEERGEEQLHIAYGREHWIPEPSDR